jgi:hypothetical protein
MNLLANVTTTRANIGTIWSMWGESHMYYFTEWHNDNARGTKTSQLACKYFYDESPKRLQQIIMLRLIQGHIHIITKWFTVSNLEH